MNAVVDNSDHAIQADRSAEVEIARMLFAIDILKQRSASEISGYLWRIKLKIARHMHRVLLRQTGMSDLETLPELSRPEQEELLKTHSLLQPDLPRSGFAEVETGWRLELESKVSRFANRVRCRQGGPTVDRSR